jgi:hypothetical protein
MNISTIITDVEDDLEGVLAHIRAVLEKNPKAPIHINPPVPPTLTVKPQPEIGSGTQPTGPK